MLEVGSIINLKAQGAKGKWLCTKFNVCLHGSSCGWEVNCYDRIYHDINAHSDIGGWGGSWNIERTYACPRTCVYIKLEHRENSPPGRGGRNDHTEIPCG